MSLIAIAMPLLFSYGTLQETKVQISLFGRVLDGQTDRLLQFEQSSVKISDPQIIAATGNTHHANVRFTGWNGTSVSGTVFELSDAELAGADQYERTAGYERIRVKLASGKQAWVYMEAHSAPEGP